MKTNTLKLSLAAGTAALLFGLAGACGDDLINNGGCVSNLDCTDPLNPTCQPFTGVCGTLDCMASTDCGGNTPSCNLADANGIRPFPTVVTDVCVCNPGSCGAGTVCSDIGGACVLPCTDTSSSTQNNVKLQCAAGTCDQGTGTCVTACTEVGMLGASPCTATETCVFDGTCEQPCESLGDCVATDELCAVDTTVTTYNSCEDPATVTQACSNVTMAAGFSRTTNGPLITGVTYNRDGMACGGAATVRFFDAVISSNGMFNMSLYTMRLRFLGEDGTETNTYSDGPGMPTHPVLTARAGAANVFDLTFTLCLSDAQMANQDLAIYMTTNSGGVSNAFCFTGQ